MDNDALAPTFQLQPVAADLCKVVLGLLHKPTLFRAAENLERLTATSRDIPRFPLTSSESVLRVTPRASAAPVMVKRKGSMH
jgi:hypothetical protein